jgi:hypothetical protein
MPTKLEILKRVQDDNKDSTSKSGIIMKSKYCHSEFISESAFNMFNKIEILKRVQDDNNDLAFRRGEKYEN